MTEVLAECRASNQLLILDCCHAGAASDTPSVDISVEGLIPGLQNKLILYASKKLEFAYEFGHLEGGFLTHTLCQILQNAPPGPVSIVDVMARTQQEAELHNQRFQGTKGCVPFPLLIGTQAECFYFDGGSGEHRSPAIDSPVTATDDGPVVAATDDGPVAATTCDSPAARDHEYMATTTYGSFPPTPPSWSRWSEAFDTVISAFKLFVISVISATIGALLCPITAGVLLSIVDYKRINLEFVGSAILAPYLILMFFYRLLSGGVSDRGMFVIVAVGIAMSLGAGAASQFVRDLICDHFDGRHPSEAAIMCGLLSAALASAASAALILPLGDLHLERPVVIILVVLNGVLGSFCCWLIRYFEQD